MPVWLAIPTAVLATLILVQWITPLAPRIGLVDHPGGHRRHAAPVPLVGGIAMFCGFLFAVLLLNHPLNSYRPLFAGAALLVIVGLLDDFHELRPRDRFIAQGLAALLMGLWGGVVLHDLGALTGAGALKLGAWALPLTLFATVGVINAFNLCDGADGLAGGFALIALVLLALAAAAADHLDLPILLLLAAVTGTFLVFNLRYPGQPRARIFMGDAGSLFLGFTLAWFLIGLSQGGPGGQRVIAPVSALWLIALPLCDTVCMMLRRALRGRSPFLADRGHLHHLLPALGLSTARAVALLLVLAALLGAFGLLAPHLGVSEKALFLGFVALFVVHCILMELGWRAVAGAPGQGHGDPGQGE